MAFPTRRTGVITSRKGERLTAPINVVVYNSTGQYVLTGSNDRTIDLWNPGTLSHIRSFTGHGYEVLDLSVNADSSLFASCGGDRAVYVWDVVAGRIVRRFHGHMQRVNAVAFNRDASVLASGRSKESSPKRADMEAPTMHGSGCGTASPSQMRQSKSWMTLATA